MDSAERPWPSALDHEEDEALRISAELAARDVAAAVSVDGLAPATATRARRLAARLAYATALRHAFPPDVMARFAAPLDAATGTPAGVGPRNGPGVRRAR